MAGDWIKMRVGLVTHPKVLALSEALGANGDYQDWSGMAGFVPALGGTQKDFEDEYSQALRVTRYVTVTALLRFWGYANEHAKDEFISSLRISDIDEIAGIPGFGSALESIGWAIYDEEKRGVTLPNFSEYNATASDRGAADRQKRYREKKKQEAESLCVTSDVTRDVTPLHREEKRREEKKDSTKFDFKKSLIDGGVSESIASDYIATRKAKKCVQTETAFKGFASEALKAGLSLADAAALCCKRGWGGFDASWVKPEDAPKATVHQMPSFFAGAR